ncbi:MAG: hypothetical protein Greene041619_485 [Candidatus Peregrinibacteria bacterium Greene0416_19]|nr:MAG: hypothetical protein Greene041619_485 [Candidatus Peregrinibacteria bacterium Greene0416_19]
MLSFDNKDSHYYIAFLMRNTPSIPLPSGPFVKAVTKLTAAYRASGMERTPGELSVRTGRAMAMLLSQAYQRITSVLSRNDIPHLQYVATNEGIVRGGLWNLQRCLESIPSSPEVKQEMYRILNECAEDIVHEHGFE